MNTHTIRKKMIINNPKTGSNIIKLYCGVMYLYLIVIFDNMSHKIRDKLIKMLIFYVSR